MADMEQIVRIFIEQHSLLHQGQQVLVALSGGADSVALLRALRQLGYPCIAAHVNFQLRGAESDRDELFVHTLCQQLQVELRVTTFDTRTYAREQGVSVEMAARDLRYGFFNQLMYEGVASVTAVAHHRDDQAETLLLNLLRGSGLHGLRGMKPRNGRFIRPLLTCSRKEIEDYLAELNQPFVTDSTNLLTDVLRNRIRWEVLPLLSELQPQAPAALAHSAHYLGQAEAFLDEAVSRHLASYQLKPGTFSRALCTDGHALFLLHEWLAPYGFNTAQQAQIWASACSQASGRRFESATHQLWLNRDTLTLCDKQAEPPLPAWEYKVREAAEVSLQKNPCMAFLDADKVAWPLCMRRVQTGDRFYPFGMKGSKLVSDYLTDHKVGAAQKRWQTVLVDARDRIVWLVGQRTDNRFRLDEHTQRVVVVQLKD